MAIDNRNRRVLVREAAGNEDREAAFGIRRRVFVDEQNVPLEHEHDAIDSDAVHVIASIDGKPVAAARLFIDSHDQHLAWIGRLAVLPESRHTGVATEIMRFLLDWSRRHGITRVRLHAQEYVHELYLKLGFTPCGDIFLEENIPHREMELCLNDNLDVTYDDHPGSIREIPVRKTKLRI